MGVSFFQRVLHVGNHRIHIVILLLQKSSGAPLVQPLCQPVHNGKYDPLMAAEHRRDLMKIPGGLEIQAGAVVIAAIFDGAVLAGSVGFLVFGI